MLMASTWNDAMLYNDNNKTIFEIGIMLCQLIN